MTLEKCSDVIGPECADITYFNFALAMLHKNTWYGSEKEPAVTIEDYAFVAKDKIWHDAGVPNKRK